MKPRNAAEGKAAKAQANAARKVAVRHAALSSWQRSLLQRKCDKRSLPHDWCLG